MKKMIYESGRTHLLLDHGKYKKIEYYIMSLGTHPCAYIKLPSKNKQEIINLIDTMCHGGITYHESALNLGFGTIRGDFVGWDYAHYGDYMGFYSKNSALNKFKRWTTKEILSEIKTIIDAINVCFDNSNKANVEKIQKTIEQLADDLKRKAPLIASDITDVSEITISTKIRYNEVQNWEITKKYASKDDNNGYFSLTKKK